MWGGSYVALRSAANGESGWAVGSMTRVHLLSSLAVTGWLEFGLGLPVVYATRGDELRGVRDVSLGGDVLALGDLRWVPRVRLFGRERTAERWGLALAATTTVWAPTGQRSAWASEGWRAEPGIAFSARSTRDHGVSVHAGYLARSRSEIAGVVQDDTWTWGATGEVQLQPSREGGFSVVADVFGRVAAWDAEVGSPVEAMGGLQHRYAGVTSRVGMGGALVQSGGAPVWRAQASVTLESPIRRPAAPWEPPIEEDPQDEPPPVVIPDPDPEVPPEPVPVRVVPERIDVRIAFAFNDASLDAQAERAMDEVAALLRAWPEIELVNIEGHADDIGAVWTNRRVSLRRAEAVREGLIRRGIAGERLRAVGLADAFPIELGDTDEARARNRRVEFHILRRASGEVSAPSESMGREE
jgi:outer membrane protein OmpA-like peptidoglycan-associated protein